MIAATAAGYTIREAAGKTGLSQTTVRYYERTGLVPPVRRDRSGYRRYTEDDLEWLIFVTRLRATGMPIASIATFVELALRGEATVPQRLRLLESHQQAVEAQWREGAAVDVGVVRGARGGSVRVGSVRAGSVRAGSVRL